MNPVLENKIRRSTIEQLSALRTLTSSPVGTATTSQISASTSISNQALGGVMSSLARIKVNEEPLIVPVGKIRNEGLRWKLNFSVAPKEELNTLLSDILSNTIPSSP